MKNTGSRLVLDVGNSRTKCGLFRHGRLIRYAHVATGEMARVRTFVGEVRPEAIVVGSVAHENAALMELLQSFGAVRVINGTSPSHLINRYRSPETLGADRWANATGASLLFPTRPVLAISLGTCVTYDLVNSAGEYLGGIISPGFRMRARAMGEFTARLPVVEPIVDPPDIGTTTIDCLAAGAHHGLGTELRGTIDRFGQQHCGLAVVLTGGDAPRFSRALENGIFAHPFLTLFGLHALSLSDPQAAGAVVVR